MSQRIHNPKKERAHLTPEEDHAWEFALNYYLDEGKTPLQADKLAWRDIVKEFPRLKQFWGAYPNPNPGGIPEWAKHSIFAKLSDSEREFFVGQFRAYLGQGRSWPGAIELAYRDTRNRFPHIARMPNQDLGGGPPYSCFTCGGVYGRKLKACKKCGEPTCAKCKKKHAAGHKEVDVIRGNPSRARFRHEDVSAVPAGWRVITVSHGDHRIRVAYPKRKKNKIGGADGRLISILHPIKENPAEGCHIRSTNPAELVVLGANPPRKRNPLVYVVTAAHKKDVWQGVEKPFDSLKEAQEFARDIRRRSGEFFQPHILSMQKIEYEENPKRRNPGDLVLMGANPTTLPVGKNIISVHLSDKEVRDFREKYPGSNIPTDAMRFDFTPKGELLYIEPTFAYSANRTAMHALVEFARKQMKRRANPGEAEAADKLFAEFQGRPSEKIAVTDEPHMPAGDYAQLARLVELGIEPNGHGKVVPLEFSRKDGVIIAAAPGSQQIYFVGGNQDITEILDEFEVNADMAAQPEVRLGRVRTIAYRAAKAQTGFVPSDYEHSFGEEGGELPEAIFDTRHKRILLKGGSYRIEAPGIIN